MSLIERTEPERPHKDDPPCTCGSTAVIDANRHDWRCARRLWIERNDALGAVSTVETHLHEPSRAPKGVRQADFRRGWEAARQAALIALGGAEREYPE
jgi:hypothetical protein